VYHIVFQSALLKRVRLPFVCLLLAVGFAYMQAFQSALLKRNRCCCLLLRISLLMFHMYVCEHYNTTNTSLLVIGTEPGLHLFGVFLEVLRLSPRLSRQAPRFLSVPSAPSQEGRFTCQPNVVNGVAQNLFCLSRRPSRRVSRQALRKASSQTLPD